MLHKQNHMTLIRRCGNIILMLSLRGTHTHTLHGIMILQPNTIRRLQVVPLQLDHGCEWLPCPFQLQLIQLPQCQCQHCLDLLLLQSHKAGIHNRFTNQANCIKRDSISNRMLN